MSVKLTPIGEIPGLTCCSLLAYFIFERAIPLSIANGGGLYQLKGELMNPARPRTKPKKIDQEAHLFKTYYKSPIGAIEILGTKEGIVSVNFVEGRVRSDAKIPRIITACRKQIDEYFRGKRKKFSLNLLLYGTDFQKSVWQQLLKVPHGKTASYGAIAKSIRSPNAFRAVGNANNKNPLAIVVPCHRIIGSNGNLIGYGGGLWRKLWLLEHEGILVNGNKVISKH